MSDEKKRGRVSKMLARTRELIRSLWRGFKRGARRLALGFVTVTDKAAKITARVARGGYRRAKAAGRWTLFAGKILLSATLNKAGMVLSGIGEQTIKVGALLATLAIMVLVAGSDELAADDFEVQPFGASEVFMVHDEKEAGYSVGFSDETINRTKVRDEHLETAGAFMLGALTPVEGEYEVAMSTPINDLRARYDMSDEPAHEFPFQSGSLEEQLDLYHTVMHAGYAAKETAWWTGRYHACKLVMELGDEKAHRKMWGHFGFLHRENKSVMTPDELAALRSGYQSLIEERQQVLHS